MLMVACKEGLEFARQCGVQRVHLETDCFELVQLWKLAERFGVSPAVEAGGEAAIDNHANAARGEGTWSLLSDSFQDLSRW